MDTVLVMVMGMDTGMDTDLDTDMDTRMVMDKGMVMDTGMGMDLDKDMDTGMGMVTVTAIGTSGPLERIVPRGSTTSPIVRLDPSVASSATSSMPWIRDRPFITLIPTHHTTHHTRITRIMVDSIVEMEINSNCPLHGMCAFGIKMQFFVKFCKSITIVIFENKLVFEHFACLSFPLAGYLGDVW